MTKHPLEPKFETELVIQSPGLPTLINEGGEQARERFIEFFTASIRNRGTRAFKATKGKVGPPIRSTTESNRTCRAANE